jgi:hypothetical protein
MKTLKYYLLSLFFVPVFSHSAFAQIIYEDEQLFIFSDEFYNSQEVIIGKNPWASDGLDPALGEEIIPQVPQGQFGVRFQLPSDTSIYTIKDIRFGCYWATGHEHLVDINYSEGSSSISVFWEWDSLLNFGLMDVMFINPYNGQIISSYSWFSDSSHFYIPPALDKIKIWTLYDGTLSVEEYKIISPNGGEEIAAGQTYVISWWNNQLGFYYDIEFSSDSGKSWSIVADTVSIFQNSYDWLVPQINSDYCLIRIGNYPCVYDVSDSVFTITNTVSIEEESLPKEFSLEQNYPNPFNPSTKIKFTIPSVETGQVPSVLLKVYDVLGNEIATLVNEEKPEGNYEVEFDAAGLPSGIYFYRLNAGEYSSTKKMVLLK